ncbi:GNAT family N-acetyltransferase [Cupriavidus necator]
MTIDDFCLNSSRLRLRMPALEDATALQAIAADERVALTTRIPHPYPEGGARSRIEHIRRVAGPDRRNLAITLLSSGEFIGMIGFSGASQSAELTYMISPDHWGRGYAPEAAKRLISHIFEATSFVTITASAMIANPASEAVLIKAGFQRERVADVDIPLRGLVAAMSFWCLDASKFHQSFYEGKDVNPLQYWISGRHVGLDTSFLASH